MCIKIQVFCKQSVSLHHCLFKMNLKMTKAKEADFKSATEGTKKLFIETYGCQMNMAQMPFS